LTDARIPGHWLHDPAMEQLTDRAWRTFVGSLVWSNEHGTDARLPRLSLRLPHPQGVDEATAVELVTAGKWRKSGDDYRIPNWQTSQSLARDVEHQRERNRRNQQAKRDRERAARAASSVSDDVSDDVGGQDRTGAVMEPNHSGTLTCEQQRAIVYPVTP
jgi:hypothetical protein